MYKGQKRHIVLYAEGGSLCREADVTLVSSLRAAALTSYRPSPGINQDETKWSARVLLSLTHGLKASNNVVHEPSRPLPLIASARHQTVHESQNLFIFFNHNFSENP